MWQDIYAREQLVNLEEGRKCETVLDVGRDESARDVGVVRDYPSKGLEARELRVDVVVDAPDKHLALKHHQPGSTRMNLWNTHLVVGSDEKCAVGRNAD